VSAEGDLNLNMNQQLTKGGEYWAGPDFVDLMTRLKQSPTTVNRLLFSVGSSEPATWASIQSLVTAPGGTDPESPLYRSFAALKKAIPGIDGIDFDDETTNDPKTTVPFARMLHELGYEVTFCPFSYPDFWVGCLKELNTAATPNLVTAFNLQCYAGGEGNQPSDWVKSIKDVMGQDYDAAALVYPGLWCVHDDGFGGTCNVGDCPADVTSTLAAWNKASPGIPGGWIWVIDDVIHCNGKGLCSGAQMGTAAYAEAVLAGLG
jgi:hypothetical protein